MTAPTDPDTLASALAEERRVEEVKRADELARDRAAAAHQRARADLEAEMRQQARDRAEREAAGRAAARLAEMRREALAAGERLRIKTALATSGEARAWRLERLHTWNLRVLVPALVLFGALSTSGVQKGAANLFGWTRDDIAWWALWGLEPGLIAAICWIIHVRGQLALSGGSLARSVEVVMGVALATSVGFNMASGGADQDLKEMLGHSMAPLLAAGTAWLIGAIDRSIARTNPWKPMRKGERVRSILEMPTGLDPVTDPGTPGDLPGSIPGDPVHPSTLETNPVEPEVMHPGDPVDAPGATPGGVPAPADPVTHPVAVVDTPGGAPGESNPGTPGGAPGGNPVGESDPPGQLAVTDAPGEIAPPAEIDPPATQTDPGDPGAVDVAALRSGAAKVRAAMDALGEKNAQPKQVAEWLAERGVTLKTETIRSALKQERRRRAAAAERGGVVPLQRRTGR